MEEAIHSRRISRSLKYLPIPSDRVIMRYIALVLFVFSAHASPYSKEECNGHALGGFSAELRQPSSCATHGFLLPACSKEQKKKKLKKKTQGIRSQKSS